MAEGGGHEPLTISGLIPLRTGAWDSPSSPSIITAQLTQPMASRLRPYVRRLSDSERAAYALAPERLGGV